MGNSLRLPCQCQEATAVATSGIKKRRKKPTAGGRSKAKAASSRHVVVPVLDTTPEEEEEMKMAWPGCRVEPSVDGMRVKVVMKRKDAAELMARLEERCALERKARMVELNTGLGGGHGNGSAGGVMMSPCRDAWAPRLASIPEN
ncbi:hypothetical protein E2562_022074 [Oryza meyeriana var. granulata]|uniref:Uncharacterized protein n=1 Tax=Oryza meyeriana var. granulata TaxID=110450 RepID=A0A6G1ENQ8_9ORYZ|nr:hypothetical protein E2562_022074 [Oryza meyeriana var. granulata]